jgi:PAS domain S-box-containing protein
MGKSPVRVLLIEDQEEDYLLTRRMLASCEKQEFQLDWANSWQSGIEAIRRCVHDVCLLDFRINGGDGLELLKESREISCKAPVILLTGVGDYRLDVEAMELGAADFLVKDKITAELLERSIRYALAQEQSLQELRSRQDALRASEMRFRAVVQSAADAIVLSDASGKILFWNNGAATMFGYTEDEILGAPLDTLMPEQYKERHRAGFERYLVTHRSRIVGRTVEFEGLRKDGTVFPIELSLASWTNGDGPMFTAIIRDTTERKKTEELHRAKDAAEEANRAKSAFVARMSHELRIPLHSIIGFTSLLLKNSAGNLHRQDIDFLHRIFSSAKDQLGLINSVLDLSKVEAGRMDLQLDDVSIDSLVRDVVRQLEAEQRGSNVEIVLRLPSAVQPIQADRQKLKQVLTNVVENALKFTRQGTVTVELTVNPATLEPLRIDVIDTGVGMPPDQIGKVFEPFWQVAPAENQPVKGTGLGLSICQSLCELMGYQLAVQSELGKGSTFTILLTQTNRLPLTA